MSAVGFSPQVMQGNIQQQMAKVSVDIGTIAIVNRVPPAADQPVPFWNDDPASWETVYLDATPLPGLCWLNGKVGIRRSKKTIPGKHGSKVVTYGYEPAQLQVRMVIWTGDHLQRWNDLLQVLRPKISRGMPGVVSIGHPSAAMYGITQVKVMDITLPEQDEPGMDIYNITIDLLEHIPTPLANKGKVTDDTDITKIPQALLKQPGTTAQQQPASARAASATPPSATNGGP